MKSYTTLRNLYGSLTKNTGTNDLLLGDQLINDEYRHLCAMRDFYFLHRTRTMTTTASTQFKPLPYDIDQVESLYVTVSGTRYTPKLIQSREQWDLLNETVSTSDAAQYAFIFNGELGLWPTPATSSNIITVNAKVRVIDLNTTDVTGVTITTATNGSASVVVSGSLTTQMGGFWIRPTYSTVANSGDGVWYEISSVSSATSLTLVRSYGGTSIVAGSAACTISQIPLLPEEFHDTPVFKAAATYWYKEADTERGNAFMEKYKADVEILVRYKTTAVTDPVIDDGEDRMIINPNLTVTIS